MPLQDSDPPAPKEPLPMTYDPLRPVNSSQHAAYMDFMKDPSKTHHQVEFNKMEKESFRILETSGEWLNDDVSIHA